MGAMCCECEVIDFDCEDMSFMMGPSDLKVYVHRFINTSTIETTKRGPHKGNSRKRMEVEGPCHDLQDHSSQWAALLTYQYDFRLSLHSGDIGIVV